MKSIFLCLILFCLIQFGSTQDIYEAINDTIIGNPPARNLSKIASLNLSGNIDILVLVIAFPDKDDSWVQINNNNPEYPVLGAFPDGILLSDYINTNGPVDMDTWIEPMIESFYDVHSGSKFTADVTFPKTVAGDCYVTTHNFSYWVGRNGSDNNVVWNYWPEMVNEAAENLIAVDPGAFTGIDMVQVTFADITRNQFHTKYGGVAYPWGIDIHEPGNPSNLYWSGAFGCNRNVSSILHESLHVIGNAAGFPSGFNGLPDRGYDRSWFLGAPSYETQWNATVQFDIMYHNHDLITQYSLYGQRPLLTHDLLFLGWIENVEIGNINSSSKGLKVAPVTYALSTEQLNDEQKRVFKIMIYEDYSGTLDEYFLVEYKAGLEFDKALFCFRWNWTLGFVI